VCFLIFVIYIRSVSVENVLKLRVIVLAYFVVRLVFLYFVQGDKGSRGEPGLAGLPGLDGLPGSAGPPVSCSVLCYVTTDSLSKCLHQQNHLT